jgi:hypothetical protein
MSAPTQLPVTHRSAWGQTAELTHSVKAPRCAPASALSQRSLPMSHEVGRSPEQRQLTCVARLPQTGECVADTNFTLTIASDKHYRIELAIVGMAVQLRFTGFMNEDVNFGGIVPWINEFGQGRTNLLLDLGNLTQMNSCGVREWLMFLEQIRAAKLTFSFTVISEAFADNANSVIDLLGPRGTTIGSFHAPYYCGTCQMRTMKVLRTEDLRVDSGAFAPPEENCTRCGNKLEFDGIEEEYFFFLQHSGGQPGRRREGA